MTEVPWPQEPMLAKLYWSEDSEEGFLHFIDPKGNKAIVPVTHGSEHASESRGHVWHIVVNDDVATVSPSVHYVGQWHSPNPVIFKLVEKLEGLEE